MKQVFSARCLYTLLRILASVLAVFLLGGLRLKAQNAVQQPPEMAGKTAGEYYKNVLVLKDIPATDLLPTMEFISVATGIQCGNCHDPQHFDNDDKRNKKSARNMMKLTFALDDTLFEGKRQMTCYTCHRGSNSPAINPEVAGEMPPRERTARVPPPAVVVPNLTVDSTMGVAPNVPQNPGAGNPAGGGGARPPQPVLPSVDDVLTKYIAALGGPDATLKVASLSEKGTIEMAFPNPPGVQGPPTVAQVPSEIYRKAPNKLVTVIHGKDGISQEGFDGKVGWRQFPGYVGEDTGGILAVLKRSAEIVPAVQAKTNYTALVVDAIEKIGDRSAYRMIGQRPNGVDRLYFDTQTGLLIRLWTTMDTPLGSFPEELNFEDYRDVSGVKIPFTVHLASPQGDRIYKWSQVTVDGSVDDGVFAQPAPRPPTPPPAQTNNK